MKKLKKTVNILICKLLSKILKGDQIRYILYLESSKVCKFDKGCSLDSFTDLPDVSVFHTRECVEKKRVFGRFVDRK